MKEGLAFQQNERIVILCCHYYSKEAKQKKMAKPNVALHEQVPILEPPCCFLSVFGKAFGHLRFFGATSVSLPHSCSD
jgi:hypothetical protein